LELLLRLLYLREYIISTFYQATILSTGLPLIERWPFNDRCWYRFVQSLSALDYFQAAGSQLLSPTFQVSLDSTISHTRCGYRGRHKVPFLSCDSDETRHIVWGEFRFCHLYCGHSSFVMRLKLHLTSFGQNIDNEVQAASGYCISFVYRDYGHYSSGTFGNG
jgi:hypothetical protein